MSTSRLMPYAAIATFLAPSLGLAQAQEMARASEQRPMYELPTLTVLVSTETPLDVRAAELYQGGDWKAAADVYREAAEGEPVNGAEAYQAYDMAARLYFYGRDFGRARASMERAAAIAESTGDVVSAAYRHVDAAFIAVWEGYPGSRRDHVAKAKELSATDGFGEEHARKIESLIHGVGALPVMGDDSD